MTEEFQIKEEESGIRLDKLLAGHFPDITRSYLQSLIREGNVTLNGNRSKQVQSRRQETVSA